MSVINSNKLWRTSFTQGCLSRYWKVFQASLKYSDFDTWRNIRILILGELDFDILKRKKKKLKLHNCNLNHYFGYCSKNSLESQHIEASSFIKTPYTKRHKTSIPDAPDAAPVAAESHLRPNHCSLDSRSKRLSDPQSSTRPTWQPSWELPPFRPARHKFDT